MNLTTERSTSTQHRSADWPADAVPESWIDSLFTKMTGFYGSKFLDMWRGVDMQDVRRMWGLELAELKREELKRGVATLVTRQFPPTLPEFIQLCRPRVHLESALDEAIREMGKRANGQQDVWTDPAYYWAAAKIGHWDMRQLSRDALLKRFAAALDDVRRNPVEPVPPVMQELPAPGEGVTDRATAQENMAKVKAHCAVWARQATSQNVRDGLLWAYRIAEKVQRGEPVNAATERLAREALEEEKKRHAAF